MEYFYKEKGTSKGPKYWEKAQYQSRYGQKPTRAFKLSIINWHSSIIEMYHGNFSPSLLSNLSSSSELSSSSMGLSTRNCKSAPAVFHPKNKNDFCNEFFCTAFKSHHASRYFQGMYNLRSDRHKFWSQSLLSCFRIITRVNNLQDWNCKSSRNQEKASVWER